MKVKLNGCNTEKHIGVYIRIILGFQRLQYMQIQNDHRHHLQCKSMVTLLGTPATQSVHISSTLYALQFSMD